jgi:hypothetical protein
VSWDRSNLNNIVLWYFVFPLKTQLSHLLDQDFGANDIQWLSCTAKDEPSREDEPSFWIGTSIGLRSQDDILAESFFVRFRDDSQKGWYAQRGSNFMNNAVAAVSEGLSSSSVSQCPSRTYAVPTFLFNLVSQRCSLCSHEQLRFRSAQVSNCGQRGPLFDSERSSRQLFCPWA